jgi:predicted cupin superfamily sugar epimerase
VEPRSAAEIAAALGLRPHPEGGSYRETWRDEPAGGARGHGSSILFLLAAGERSRRHRLDATEVWHFHAGAPLELTVEAPGGGAPEPHLLGLDFASGARPQIVVPAGAWQSARSLGAWTLVGCTVSPAFTFEGFELDDEPVGG